MAWRVDVQPNGKYAIFSDVVSSFIQYNLSRKQAVEYCFTEIVDAETHYQEQLIRLDLPARSSARPTDWSPAPNGLERIEAAQKVGRGELEPARWARDVELLICCHGRRSRTFREHKAFLKRGYSTLAPWKAHLEKARRFKSGDRALTFKEDLVVIAEVLPNQWYRVVHEGAGRGLLWKDHELSLAIKDSVVRT